ncbi:MAG: Flp pilus assembly complex ATPase component TadA [Clostridia bacterium]|nr:Flp pilus assembly complex ATPase component TadA [Clostridia bacterium]
MIKDLITEKLYNEIVGFCSIGDIEEIRLRANCPVVVCINGKNYAVTNKNNECVYASDIDLNHVISRATQNSFYAVSEQIKQMFIACDGGIRIGITGEVVTNQTGIVTIKHINSLNIRIPHQVKHFADVAIKFICDGKRVYNTLIASGPGAGKTTLLRDVCRALSAESTIRNILLVDERYEIANVTNGRQTLNVGAFTDIISGGNKLMAFGQGIRSLKPNVIVTDELYSNEDYEAVRKAIQSGVNVIASVHAQNQFELLQNDNIKRMLNEKSIERIIVLNSSSKTRYQGIYDSNLKCLYMPY